jgi:AraC-like DNA-binding protein
MRVAEEIDKATIYFSEHYNEDISIDKYAENNHVSVSWFIRHFKQYTGYTPIQYILSKRIYKLYYLIQL